MQVKMTTALTGKGFNLSFGEVVTVEEKFGKSLVKGGLAVVFEDTDTIEIKKETPKKRGRKRKLGVD